MRILLTVLLALLIGCEPAIAAEDTECSNMPQRTHFSRSGTIKVGSSRSGQSAGGLGFQCSLPYMGVYTVQFNLAAPRTDPTIVTNARVICKAIIDWQVSGNFVRRVVHVTDGMSVTGTGEAVSVQLVDDSVLLTPPFNPPYDPIDYLVSVQVSEGSRASSPNPPYLLDRENPTGVILAPGVPVDIAIPQDIGASSVYVSTGGIIGATEIPPGLLGVQQVVVGAVGSHYDPRYFQWVPLLPGAIELRMFVDAAATSSSRATVFWGIDG